ncbi:MAG: hypothetical protein GC134_02755 [Proteobacteria bacterium]|nr:hypothetical protein [Pseudomonadota bacterium]
MNIFADMGEVDYYGTLALKKDGRTLTHCQFTLLQNGFSRRSWDALPADTYKGNGRVRHERVNIQLGPLANIQVHSYQAKEVKERGTDGDGVGSLEHFDIHIFRNTSLIGGQPVQSLTIRDIVPDTDVNTGFIGYNEHAREQCLLSFLSGEEGPSDLSSHKMGIQIMRAAYEGMNAAQNGHIPVSAFAL